MVGRKMKYVLIALILLAILTVAFILLRPISHTGEKSREALVTAYLANLTKENYQAMQELTPSYYESDKAIQQKLTRYGGSTFKNITTKYIESPAMGIWFVVLTGIRSDKNGKEYPYKEQLTLDLGQDDPYEVLYDPKNPSLTPKPDRWFLLLGKQKLVGPPINATPLKIRPR